MASKKPWKKPEGSQDDIQFGVNWTATAARTGQPSSSIPEVTRRMMCARWKIGDVSAYEHRKAIIRTIWPEHIFAWHYWSDRRLKSTCEHNFVTWMGPGGSAKTSDAAIQGVEYWLEAPHETAVIVCSTTKDMLRQRVWGEIVKYHSLIPKTMGYVGELLDASCFIRWRDGDWKNGIKGVAVQDGPIEEAINNIIGVHTTRIWWILDEMQGVREAIMRAIPNLLKNPESRMLGMGNPDLLTSLLCRYSEPVGGWDSIAKFQDEWETSSNGYEGTGICCFFDGRKSPAYLDEAWAKAHPWMISRKQIEDHLQSRAVGGNENDPAFMTQSIGWPPAMGVESTVLDNAILHAFKCQQGIVWTNGWTASASLDPAFGGGDRKILTFLKRGFVKDEEGERWVILFDGQIDVPIDAENKERPIHYQIMDFCKAQCQKRNIPPREFAVASSGEGGGLKAIFDQEWGAVNGIEEGGIPSERQVEMGKTARQAYDTRASELAMGLREMALSNGIRGLPIEAAEQACKRETFYKNGKWCVEPKTGSKGRVGSDGKAKKGFKQRLGYSPDHFDSCMIGVEHCRMMGAEPGSSHHSVKPQEDWQQRLRREDQQYSEANYVAEGHYAQYA